MDYQTWIGLIVGLAIGLVTWPAIIDWLRRAK